MIKFTAMDVTPEMASKWLRENNENNRGIKTQVVKKYARDLLDGNWRVTHQCIAFDARGMLVDGQHRLSAIVLAGKSMTAYIATYETQEDAMKLPIDMQAKRAVFEVLHVSRRDQETAMAFLRIVLTNAILVTMSEVEHAIEILRDKLTAVHSCITGTVKYRSAAPARAAIELLMGEFPDRQEELCRLYRAFVAMDLEGLPSSILALLKNLDGGTLKSGGADQTELALRVYYAFHPNNRSVKIIRLLDQVAMLKQVRENAKQWFK
jgi:hypothetical protein